MSAELQRVALDRLHAASHQVTVVRLLVDHPGRSTFEALIDGRRCAVKAEPDRGIAARETSATRWAHASGLGAPEVLFADDDGDVAVLAVEWVEGVALGEHGRPEDWAAAGAELRKLHDAVPPAGADSFSEGGPWWEFFERWTTRECAEAVEYETIDGATAERAEKWLLDWLSGRAEPAMSFMHGDLQPEHVIVTASGVSMIDWGDASMGDPVWDLAVLLLVNPGRTDDVLAGYGPCSEFSDRAHAYRLLRHLGAINWMVEHEFDPTALVDELHSQLRG